MTICQQQFAKMAGFGLTLKLILYLQSQCLSKSLYFLDLPHLQTKGKTLGKIALRVNFSQ